MQSQPNWLPFIWYLSLTTSSVENMIKGHRFPEEWKLWWLILCVVVDDWSSLEACGRRVSGTRSFASFSCLDHQYFLRCEWMNEYAVRQYFNNAATCTPNQIEQFGRARSTSFQGIHPNFSRSKQCLSLIVVAAVVLRLHYYALCMCVCELWSGTSCCRRRSQLLSSPFLERPDDY